MIVINIELAEKPNGKVSFVMEKTRTQSATAHEERVSSKLYELLTSVLTLADKNAHSEGI